MKKLLLSTTLILLFSALYAQESIIKEFSEPRRPTRWMNPICLYPSTLRMINVSGDPNFNELVNDIDKILIYNLDSATVAGKNYASWLKEYEAIGYEEYLRLSGPQNVRISGKKNEYVGLLQAEDRLMTFYLRGDIPFHKIPNLIQSFQSQDLLGIVTEQFK